MILRKPAVRAILKRDLRRWFGNPAGYVFITLFVLAAAAALFGPDRFFQSNLANLDTLNNWFHRLLLFFIPAITMTIWAGERGQGTDELLLTLPASDSQIVLGKYLAGAGIYTIALVFTLPLLCCLAYLGDPDWGLLVSNYVGYWLLGLTLLAAGMVGSQLSDNLTIAFIFGAIICGLVISAENILPHVVPGLFNAWVGYGPVALFQEMSRGVLSLASLVLFIGMIGAFLYLNLLLLSRRHWRQGGEGVHLGVRFGSVLVATLAVTLLGANWGGRLDATAERIHSLSNETTKLISELDDERPVYIQAFVSPEVPRDFVQTRRTLLNLLREYDALGGNAVQVRIIDIERYSKEARDAEATFGIRHVQRFGVDAGGSRTFDICLGLAFTCGLEEVVISFLDKGLSVEYELTRSIRVVASAERDKVGVLDTEVKIFGGLDFQTMRQSPEWEIVRELKLQYDVERVDPGSDYPDDLDVLLAVMPSTLNHEQMERLGDYIKAGRPTLILDDPFPASAPGMAPSDPKGGQQNPFMGGQPPPEPKGDIAKLMEDLNIRWDTRSIVWDRYNPHPAYDELEWEIVFVAASSETSQPFNPDHIVTSGLQEVVAIFPGFVRLGGKNDMQFIPLLRTTRNSGANDVSIVFQRSLFGMNLNRARPHNPDGLEKILACRVTGKPTEESESVNVTFFADLDMFSDQFFDIRAQGLGNFDFDNVTLILNAIDELAGSTSFVELRKRRPQHRTLKRIEAQEKEFEDTWFVQRQTAESKAKSDLDAANARFNEKVDEIRKRTDLDERSKRIQIETVREVEQRRLNRQKAKIEEEKNRALEIAKADQLSQENEIRNINRFGALVISPIPAILLGMSTFARRRRRERESIIGGMTGGSA